MLESEVPCSRYHGPVVRTVDTNHHPLADPKAEPSARAPEDRVGIAVTTYRKQYQTPQTFISVFSQSRAQKTLFESEAAMS